MKASDAMKEFVTTIAVDSMMDFAANRSEAYWLMVPTDFSFHSRSLSRILPNQTWMLHIP